MSCGSSRNSNWPYFSCANAEQVNDEISRQIFDDLDKQLDAQMMAELEKCQEEQSRRIDDELDRQVGRETVVLKRGPV